MAVTWNSYKEKRREKNELRRFAYSFIVLFLKTKKKKILERALYAKEKKHWAEKMYKS